MIIGIAKIGTGENFRHAEINAPCLREIAGTTREIPKASVIGGLFVWFCAWRHTEVYTLQVVGKIDYY